MFDKLTQIQCHTDIILSNIRDNFTVQYRRWIEMGIGKTTGTDISLIKIKNRILHDN